MGVMEVHSPHKTLKGVSGLCVKHSENPAWHMGNATQVSALMFLQMQTQGHIEVCWVKSPTYFQEVGEPGFELRLPGQSLARP